jgi:alpha-beta hydrolase superfamily lysophospholipase
MAFDRESKLHSPTGATLLVRFREARGPPRGAVQVNHGLAEHSARYARFADFLSERGFHVYAHDHRGHGGTTAPSAPPRMFARDGGAAKVVDDIMAVHSHIRANHPGVPIVLFGHSMGGLSGMNFLLKHSAGVHAAAICNANFSAGALGRVAQGILAWERFRLGSDVPSRILPKLTFQAWAKQIKDRRTEFDWLSRDPAEVGKYIADPLCGWDASVSMWRDVFDFVFAGADDRNYATIRRDLPLYLVGGENDPATDGGKAVRAHADRLKRMGFSNLVSTIYPQTRHESLNEVNRDEVMRDLGEWLDRVAPQR